MTDKFREERKTGIGGSDAGAVCGVSKWRTPYQVYADKLGLNETEDNPAMEWGRRLEPIVRQKYADETGRIVIVNPDLIRHPQYKFMIAHTDGLIQGEKRGLEVKTSRSPEGWGEAGTDEIPIEYIFQTQHYMIVAQIEVIDVAVLIGGQDFRIYEVPADKELQDMIIETEHDFWEKNVKAQVPPEPVNMADIKLRWKTSTEKPINCDMATFQAWDALQGLLTDKKATDANIESLQAQIMAFMKENDTLLDSQGLTMVTWRSNKKGRETVDSKKLKAEMPEIYELFKKIGEPVRRFLIKGKEG